MSNSSCAPALTDSFAVIISGSGRYGAATVTNLLRPLAGKDDQLVRIVASSAEATTAARSAAVTAKTVVAVGGDGTVADVATGIFGTGAALGIVPTGSTNITARSLGIPASPRSAVALLSGLHRRRRVDVGVSGDRCFLHIAGAGVDAELFSTTDRGWKRRVGWLAYLPPAVASLRFPPSDVVVTIDGTTLETRSPLVLVANGASAVAPSLKLLPQIRVDDGWLDLLVFTATTPWQIAETLGHFGGRRLDRSPHVIWRRAKSVRIEAEPPLPVELDGDPLGATPREFSVVTSALEVVVPDVAAH